MIVSGHFQKIAPVINGGLRGMIQMAGILGPGNRRLERCKFIHHQIHLTIFCLKNPRKMVGKTLLDIRIGITETEVIGHGSNALLLQLRIENLR